MTKLWAAWVGTWAALLGIAAVTAAIASSEADGFLIFAASTLVMTGLAHSVLGERYVLLPIFRRRDLPRLFGDERFISQTLRFAWHLLTVSLWGLAAVLIALAGDSPPTSITKIIAATATLAAVISGIISRGRHVSWAAFLAVAIAAWLST